MRNRLLQLLAENRRSFTPIASRVVAEEEGEATVYLYDPIVDDRVMAEFWGGVCPQDFVPAVRAIDAKVIHLRVNSPGGSVFAAEAMGQCLREHAARVVAHIEGLAASAATQLCCACDEVRITPSSLYMIHQTWALAIGNERDMLAMADLLKKCDESMYAEYARRTGNDLARLREWCEAETWFTAEQAVEHGFVDSITQPKKAAKASANGWKLSAFKHPPVVQTPGQDIHPEGEGGTPAAPGAGGNPAPGITDASVDHRARQQQRLRVLQLAAPIV